MNLFFSKIVPFIRYVGKYWIAGQATDENILRSMRFACWISKATNTHSECAILIAFPLQQWLHERALMLRHTYLSCLVVSCKQTS